VQFNHPFFQAVCMFLGEFLCLLVFRALILRAQMKNEEPPKSSKPFNRFILLLPALCDMTATSLMYTGLNLTDASVFQMLRGSVVIFTGIFRVVFLKKPQRAHNWIGMALVMVGTAVVGMQSQIKACNEGGSASSSATSNAVLGNILIIVAQLIVAVQMTVEEKFIGGYDIPPLQVVGWEGIFGFCTLSVVLGIMYMVPAPAAFCEYPGGQYGDTTNPVYPSHCGHFEDTYDAFVLMGNSPLVTGMLLLNILSIAFFNFFGVSVTKHINATTRMVLDSMRTIIIWAFSMGVGWETFCYVQIVGFVTLLSGTLIYNELIKLPWLTYAALDDEDDGKVADDEAEEGYGRLMADSDAVGSLNTVGGRKK
jgi:uncharacterized membrane protein